MSDEIDTSDEVARLAGSIRRVVDRLVGTTAPPEAFGAVSDDLDALAARLEAYEQHPIFRLGGPTATEGGVTDYSPITGRLHPFAPPVRVTSVGRRVEGTVTFGSAYEGPPGYVHGGFVAATLDELLGMTLAVQHLPGMTGRLTVRYRRATPLHTELRVVAEVGRVDGRKVHVDGRIEHDSETCAEADGLFLLVDFDRFRRRDREGPAAKEDPAGP